MQNQSELFSNVNRIIYTPSLCRPRQQWSETLVQTRRQEANRTETQTFEDVSKTTITMWNKSKLNEAAQFTAPKKNSLQGGGIKKTIVSCFFVTDLDN